MHQCNVMMIPSANYTHLERRSKSAVHGSSHSDNFGSSMSLSSTNNNGDLISIAAGSKSHSSENVHLINNELCNVCEHNNPATD